MDTAVYSPLGHGATGNHQAQAAAATKPHADILDTLLDTAEGLFDQQTAEDYMERVLFNMREGLFVYQSAEDYTMESLYDHQTAENYMELVVQASATQSPSAAAVPVKPKHKDTTPQAVLSADT